MLILLSCVCVHINIMNGTCINIYIIIVLVRMIV